MSDMLLEYYIARMGEGAFTFRITMQDERLTTYVKSRVNQTFHASNGWRVMIDKHPEIDTSKKIIFLQGALSDEDGRIDAHEGLREKETKELIKNIDRALQEVGSAAVKWIPAKVITKEKFYVVNSSNYDPYFFVRKNPRFIVVDPLDLYI